VILAIDQGTTGTTCVVVDDELGVRGRGYRELRQHFPRPGWVEHDPWDIWATVVGAADAAVHAAGVLPADLRAIGITNQRETTLLWERATGRPVDRAIVWQDRRTASRCRELPGDLIRARTGLVPDPYFSATKLEWLLARTDARPSELAFGTVDAWLVWQLTDGRVHATDLTNASRTMLLDLASLDWDDELLDLFDIDRALLPHLVRSCEVVGEAKLLGATMPIAGIAGDQQAALFGHGCHERGEAKATYGTGSFVLVNAGTAREPAPPGLLETATATGGYALEGAILSGGAAIQWLRDGLGILDDPAESETLARQVESTGGVYFVPALTGLGSPHWNADARGLLSGITRGTTAAHIVRAALEAIAFQVADVLDALPGGVAVLRADGGASSNGFLMQFQADLLGCPVEVAADRETTAFGAAALAGLTIGLWPNLDAIRPRIRRGATYEPTPDRAGAARHRAEWQIAVRRTLLTS
jgi:glycerol kinase